MFQNSIPAPLIGFDQQRGDVAFSVRRALAQCRQRPIARGGTRVNAYASLPSNSTWLTAPVASGWNTVVYFSPRPSPSSPRKLTHIATAARPGLLVLCHHLRFGASDATLLREVQSRCSVCVVSARDLDRI